MPAYVVLVYGADARSTLIVSRDLDIVAPVELHPAVKARR
jgi:hypothetical protein